MTSKDVEYEIEKMIPEIKDLEERKIFTLFELKKIMKKRRNFEFQLKKFKKELKDFKNYIEFEKNLNELRISRKKKFNLDSRDVGITISDYSLVKRIHVLYQKMLKIFPMELSAHVEYINWAASVQSSKALSRTLAQAIQFHPNISLFWILAAKWEWDHNQSIAAARVLLQRGIRVNPHLQDLWVEYFKLEIAWILKLQARRFVLFGNTFSAKEDENLNQENNTASEVNETNQINNTIDLKELDQEKGISTQPTDLENSIEMKEAKQESSHSTLNESLSDSQKNLLFDFAIPKAIYRASKKSLPDAPIEYYQSLLHILIHVGPQTIDFCDTIYTDIENLAAQYLLKSKSLHSKIYDQTRKNEYDANAAQAFHVLCQKSLQNYSFIDLSLQQDSAQLDSSHPSFPLALDSACQEYESIIARLDSFPTQQLLVEHYLTFLLEVAYPNIKEENLLQFVLLRADSCCLTHHETSTPPTSFYIRWYQSIPSLSSDLKAKIITNRGSWMSETTSGSSILDYGISRYPQNGSLWIEMVRVDSDLLEIALSKVKIDNDGILVWKYYLDTLATQADSKRDMIAEKYKDLNTQYEKCVELFSGTDHFQAILSQYLHHLVTVQNDIEKAYSLINTLTTSSLQSNTNIVLSTFVDLYVKKYQQEWAEMSQSDQRKHLKRIEKLWVLLHDVLPNDIEKWIDQIRFELSVDSVTGTFMANGGQGASQVYWKALKTVDASLVPVFEKLYQQILNEQ